MWPPRFPGPFATNTARNKGVLSLAAKYVAMCFEKSMSHGRRKLKREAKLDSFDIAASFKNMGWRSDTFLESDRAFFWWRTSAALPALHGTTETKLKNDGAEFRGVAKNVLSAYFVECVVLCNRCNALINAISPANYPSRVHQKLIKFDAITRHDVFGGLVVRSFIL